MCECKDKACHACAGECASNAREYIGVCPVSGVRRYCGACARCASACGGEDIYQAKAFADAPESSATNCGRTRAA